MYFKFDIRIISQTTQSNEYLSADILKFGLDFIYFQIKLYIEEYQADMCLAKRID